METQTKHNELIVQLEQSRLPNEIQVSLREKFLPFYEQAEEWHQKSKEIIVTDISHTKEMEQAREGRLILKTIRGNVEKERKAMKENYFRTGQAIDSVAKVLTSLIEPIENSLKEKEEFAEREEARLKSILKEKRTELLSPFVSDTQLFSLDEISEEAFTQLFEGAKLQHEKRIADEKKAQDEIKEKEKAEAEAREKQRLENIRLKAEAEEKERQLIEIKLQAKREQDRIELHAQLERNAAAADVKKAKEISDKAIAKAKAIADGLAAELKAKADAEAKEKKERELAEKKLQRAPDKDKLFLFASAVAEMADNEYAKLKSEDAKIILQDANKLLVKVSIFIKEKIKEL